MQKNNKLTSADYNKLVQNHRCVAKYNGAVKSSKEVFQLSTSYVAINLHEARSSAHYATVLDVVDTLNEATTIAADADKLEARA